jgi:hypothetical protein
VAEDRACVAERGVGLAAGGGGERLDDRDTCLALGVFAGPQVAQPGQQGLCGVGRRRREDVVAKDLGVILAGAVGL